MAVAWTTIPAGDVDVDSPVTTALVTALRDNPEGIAQRATGAPKIFGVPYDYQEFLSGVGPWVKPSAAETGDFAIIQIVAGGGSGGRNVGSGASNRGGGGGGGGGVIFKILLSELDASIALTIGAGGGGVSGGATAGVAGGNSTFTDTIHDLVATGGGAGATNSIGGAGGAVSDDGADFIYITAEGEGGGNDGTQSAGVGSRHTGGGGGEGTGANPGASETAGHGGHGGTGAIAALNGVFPGGGGGGADSDLADASGDGADGVIRIWCVKES